VGPPAAPGAGPDAFSTVISAGASLNQSSARSGSHGEILEDVGCGVGPRLRLRLYLTISDRAGFFPVFFGHMGRRIAKAWPPRLVGTFHPGVRGDPGPSSANETSGGTRSHTFGVGPWTFGLVGPGNDLRRVGGRSSGAHLNPAVTLGFLRGPALRRRSGIVPVHSRASCDRGDSRQPRPANSCFPMSATLGADVCRRGSVPAMFSSSRRS